MEPLPEPAISVVCRLRKYAIDAPRIRQLAVLVCRALDTSAAGLSIEFVGTARIRSLNHTWRHIDRATDVLSFPLNTWKKPRTVSRQPHTPSTRKIGSAPISPLGDIVICLDQARYNAMDIGQDLDREVAFLLIHSLLHLCGHDHHTPREERLMLQQQRTLLALMSVNPRRPLWKGCVRHGRR